MAKPDKAPPLEEKPDPARRPKCGIVRPIADMEPYPAGHWVEVHDILNDAVSSVGYEARLVSENESVGVILGNIVTNLYSDPIVICDVSGRNPNVMFELGMRIAFEKPAIIITDDITPFSFDISPVRHLIYPNSLRFKSIVQFKEEVATALLATVAAAKEPAARGYLQQFGPIEATELGSQVISPEEIVEDLREIKRSIRALQPRPVAAPARAKNLIGAHFIDVTGMSPNEKSTLQTELLALPSVAAVNTVFIADQENLRVDPSDTRESMMAEIWPIKKRLKLRPSV